MSKITGRLVSLGIAKETTRGGGAAPAMWMPQTEFSVADKVEKVRDNSGFGNLADSQDIAIAEKYAEGDISGQLRDQTFGYWLLALLGSVTSGASGAGYSHSFTLSQSNQHQSLALTKKDAISAQQFKLTMLKSLGIKVALDSFVGFTAGIIAKNGMTTTATPSFTAENRFTKKHVTVKLGAAITDLAAAAALDVKSLEINFEKNLVRDSAFGTCQPIDILNKSISVSGSFSLNYEDQTFHDYLLAGTKKAMRLTLSNTDVDLGGGLRPSLTIDLPSVDFEWTPNYALEEIVSQTIQFKANYDLTNAQQIIHACTLVNGKANYTA